MKQELYANGQLVGVLTADGDHVWFEYDSEWLKNGFPLSSNMPLSKKPARFSANVFLGNLFPEEKRRDLISRLKRISPDFILPFLRIYGEDLPGAISVIPREECRDPGKNAAKKRI